MALAITRVDSVRKSTISKPCGCPSVRARAEAAVAHLAYEKARDVVAGFLELDQLCQSVQRAVRPDRSPRGRDLASRCQNTELMRSCRRRGYRSLLVDIGGAKHTGLHRRDRQARGFESRAFRSGCGRRARDHEGGGYDG